MMLGAIKLASAYYHGSPVSGLTSLNPGSYVTKDKATAELMGRYHLDSGKTWSDVDLAEPHYFGKAPKWKKEPMGKPYLYQVNTNKRGLNLMDNPYEHTTLKDLPVKLAMTQDEYVRIMVHNQQKQQLMHHFLRVNKWAPPAGRVDPGEVPLQAAVRELKERTGLEGAPEHFKPMGLNNGFNEFSVPFEKLKQIAKPGELGGYSTETRWQ